MEENLGGSQGGLSGPVIFAPVGCAPRVGAVASTRPWPCLGQRSLEAVVGAFIQGAAARAEESSPY